MLSRYYDKETVVKQTNVNFRCLYGQPIYDNIFIFHFVSGKATTADNSHEIVVRENGRKQLTS